MSSRMQNAELQLSEIEMLQSMFPNNDEVIMEDELTFAELKEFVEDSGVDPKRNLKLNVKLPVENFHFDISCTFLQNYPSEDEISVCIRCNHMNKVQYKEINDNVKVFIKDLGIGDLRLFQVIEWITENGINYVNTEEKEASKRQDQTPSDPQLFSRLWIYSHHIYSKTKRKNILEWAKELDLTGFSMPGKPGIVCVEGPHDNCEEFWQRMKRQTWKRLNLVHIEEGFLKRSSENSEVFHPRFTDPVTEKDFGVHGGRDYHMDLGQFANFLADHQCKHVFSIIFGVEGKLKSNDEKG